MNPQYQTTLPAISVETWNEELARDKKFKEAVQRRAAEKKICGEGQRLRKTSDMERLMIES